MTEPAWVPNPQSRGRAQSSDEARYRAEAASYVADLTADLAVLARKHGLDALGFILEMAKLEAENAVRHTGRRG
jgi:hypothetical protein